MKPVLELISLEKLEGLASRSNFRYGKNIFKNGDVGFEKVNAFNLVGMVEGGGTEKRSVEITSTAKGLRWKCSCTAKKDFFCKHCVALGLKALEKES